MDVTDRFGSDLRGTLCLVTDRSFREPGFFLDVVDEAIAGGATMVQLRDKDPARSTRDIYEDGMALRALCSERRIPLIVNDRLDLAMALDANGVHLGQGDLPIAVARRLWPSGGLFGVSASSLGEAVAACRDGADYVGFGAVYPTATKLDAATCGLEELERVARGVAVPVIAIGGIGVDRVREVMDRRCAGIAVVAAIWGHDDPRAAAAAMSDILASFRDTTEPGP